MATWAEVSLESYEAALVLLGEGHYRSSISRAYYAAYAAVTAKLENDNKVQFRHKLNNPSHEQLLALAASNLNRKQYSQTYRKEISKSLI